MICMSYYHSFCSKAWWLGTFLTLPGAGRKSDRVRCFVGHCRFLCLFRHWVGVYLAWWIHYEVPQVCFVGCLTGVFPLGDRGGLYRVLEGILELSHID